MAKKFAVIRKWKDNENNFQVLEYCETIADCKDYIRTQKKSYLYKDEIAKFEFDY